MSITILIPTQLRATCRGAREFTLAASSLRAALDELARTHPALFRSVCDETGSVRRHINVFVNSDHMRDLGGLEAPLAEGDVITILPAVSGG